MSLADTARRLIGDKGELVVFKAPDDVPSFDPITGDAQAGSAGTSFDAYGVPTRYRLAEVDGERILSSDTRLIVGVNSFLPARGWGCSLEGRAHRVMDVQKVRQSGENVLLIAQLRGN